MRRRPYPGRIVNIMDEPGCNACWLTCARGRALPTRRWHRLRRLPFADLGFAKVDHHRGLRQGLPEAVYGQGKTPAQCARSWVSCWPSERRTTGGPVILTRADAAQVSWSWPTPGGAAPSPVWPPAGPGPRRAVHGGVASGPPAGPHAGGDRRTSDLPVARECAAALAALGPAADRPGRLRGGRRPPPAGLGGRARRCRRRGGGGRDGGGPGQPGRRDHPGAGGGRARRAPATAPPSRG